MKVAKKSKTETIRELTERASLPLKGVAVLTFVLLWVLLFIGVMPEQANWEIGTVATRDLQADRSVTYEDKAATEARQKEALKDFKEVYKLNMERFNNLTLVAVDNVFSQVTTLVTGKTDNDRANQAVKTMSESEHRSRLEDSYGLRLSDEEWAKLLARDGARIELLHKQLVAILSDVMSAGVKQEDLAKARADIEKTIDRSNAFDELDRKMAKELLQSVTIYPTLVYDQAATQQRKNDIIRQVEPVWHTVQKGQMIVSRGDIVDAGQYDAMQALGLTTDRSVVVIGLGVFGIILLIYLGLDLYLKRFSENRETYERDFKLILLILLFNMVMAAIVFSIRIGDTTAAIQQVGYLAPLAAGALLTAVLIGTREAVFVLVLSTVMVSLYAHDASFALASLLGGIAAISQTRLVNRRLDLASAGAYIALVMALTAVSYGLVAGSSLQVIALGVFYAIVNGFLSIVLTIGLLPYFEVGFNINTSMSLLELGDPGNELLRRLMYEAPGTYHHSVMVANLAEAAAGAIGADALLVRTGAYYHDIGKLRRPLFFSENQFGEDNPYDALSPSLATLIITAHVKDGVAMAKEAHLPQAIIDMIAQHHGNTVVQYFYAKACEEDPEVQEQDYRYHQSRPQTREAAILMMADSVEAAARSARSTLSAGQMEPFIRNIIRGKQADGQFEECDLTFKDLNLIAEAFHRVLIGLYHKRIKYPSTVELKAQVEER